MASSAEKVRYAENGGERQAMVNVAAACVAHQDGDVPRIQKLEPDVVNRIAAGEVVQRPANAVKVRSWDLDRGLTHMEVRRCG